MSFSDCDSEALDLHNSGSFTAFVFLLVADLFHMIISIAEFTFETPSWAHSFF